MSRIKKNYYRTLEFKQEPFLKPYIECIIHFRLEEEKEGIKIIKQNAKSQNNAIFGKSI